MPYTMGWLARCMQLLTNHRAGVSRLTILATGSCGLLRSVVPDRSEHIQSLAETVAGQGWAELPVQSLFTKTAYEGPAELFTMHLCFAGAAWRTCCKHLSPLSAPQGPATWLSQNAAMLKEHHTMLKQRYRCSVPISYLIRSWLSLAALDLYAGQSAAAWPVQADSGEDIAKEADHDSKKMPIAFVQAFQPMDLIGCTGRPSAGN